MDAAKAAAAANGGRGEELEADPDQYQDPENETGLFAGEEEKSEPEELGSAAVRLTVEQELTCGCLIQNRHGL